MVVQCEKLEIVLLRDVECLRWSTIFIQHNINVWRKFAISKKNAKKYRDSVSKKSYCKFAKCYLLGTNWPVLGFAYWPNGYVYCKQ